MTMNTAQQPIEIIVVNLNCWGLPVITQDRPARIYEIGRELKHINPTLVSLQELFLEEDQNAILNIVKDIGLVYTQYFPSGLAGSGLFMLSKFPIIGSNYFPFSLNGNPQDLTRPDYYAGKGLALVQVESPIGILHFYNTHLIAPYLEIGNDFYYHHRLIQCLEIAQIVNKESTDIPVILNGDMNSTPDSLEYGILQQISNMSDSYLEANPNDPGITISEDIPYITNHEPVRVDYIFYRSSMNIMIDVKTSELSFKVLPADAAEEILAYSDHYGVTTTFTISPMKNNELKSSNSPASELLKRIIFELDISLEKLSDNMPKRYYNLGLINILAIAAALALRSKSISRRQFLKIGLWILFSFSLLLSGLQIANISYISEEKEKILFAIEDLEKLFSSN